MRFDRLIPPSLGAVSALVLALPAAAAQLQSWQFDAEANRLVFTTDVGVQPRAQLIFNPTRVVIDLPGTRLSQPPSNRSIGGPVREVRSGQFNSETARLVIELSEGYTIDPRRIQVQGVRDNRWVVQLPTPERATVGAQAASPASPNVVRGQVNSGAATQLDAVLTTPDGFFLRTRGEAPQITVDRQGEAGEARQLTIELANTSISPLLQPESLPVNRYSISRWEVTQVPQDPPVTRLALTLSADSPDWQVTTTNLGGVILVPPSGVSIGSIPDQAPVAGSSNAATPDNAAQRITVPPRAQQPAVPPRSQTPADPPRPRTEQPIVVLDPGHGGRDPGAVGIGGLQEKTIVLPVALRVSELLQDQGIQVVMTRADDRSLDLEPRVDLANRVNGTIFVSIHANAISLSRPDVNGIETYYYSESGRRLAEIMHANILPASGMRDRGVKQARFFVLRHTAMPATLLEIGFVTGEQDVPRLRDQAWRERMAQAIANGIVQYLRAYN